MQTLVRKIYKNINLSNRKRNAFYLFFKPMRNRDTLLISEVEKLFILGSLFCIHELKRRKTTEFRSKTCSRGMSRNHQTANKRPKSASSESLWCKGDGPAITTETLDQQLTNRDCIIQRYVEMIRREADVQMELALLAVFSFFLF